MSKLLLTSLAFLCIFMADRTILAQTNISVALTTSAGISSYDASYDFDVYARSSHPKTKYFIVYTLEDGSTLEDGPIESRDSAIREIFFNFEHGLIPEGTVNTDVEARQVLDGFSLFGRYGTYWQALTIAMQLEAFELETEIRWVRVPVISPYLKARILRY